VSESLSASRPRPKLDFLGAVVQDHSTLVICVLLDLSFLGLSLVFPVKLPAGGLSLLNAQRPARSAMEVKFCLSPSGLLTACSLTECEAHMLVPLALAYQNASFSIERLN
jgi:hypothetical protein